MFKSQRETLIDEDHVNIIWETTAPVLFSPFKASAVSDGWKKWDKAYLRLREDGVLIHCNASDSLKNKYSILRVCFITIMDLKEDNNIQNSNVSDDFSSTQSPLVLSKEVGVTITLCTIKNIETKIRFIIFEKDLEDLFFSIRLVSNAHNLDNLQRISVPPNTSSASSSSSFSSTSRQSINTSQPNNNINNNSNKNNNNSFRKAINVQLDELHKSNRKTNVVNKRGAFKYLPVLFSNDLVHGSWWFFLGSIGVVLSSAVVLGNSYGSREYLGEDDSVLTRFHYRGV